MNQIEKMLGIQARIFAYPYSHRNRNTVDILQQAGFTYAFTFENGMTASS